jgi:hypothetical protein
LLGESVLFNEICLSPNEEEPLLLPWCDELETSTFVKPGLLDGPLKTWELLTESGNRVVGRYSLAFC